MQERQREQQIRERLEEPKREKAEERAARQRVLAQIEADRRDRFGNGSGGAPVATHKPSSPTEPVRAATPVNSNEVRRIRFLAECA